MKSIKRRALNSLAALGQADQLIGAAGYAMCERIDEAAARCELDRLAGRLNSDADSDAFQLRGEFAEAYRMIDGSCRSSCVVASNVEWLSVTWAHGFATDAVLPTHSTAGVPWRLHRSA